jgi:hypothetical protein
VSPFVLSVLKYGLLVLLYFFVFRALRSVATDVRGKRQGATRQARAPAAAPPAKASKGGRPPAQVVVHDAGGDKATTVRLSGPTEIGRGNGCAIRLQDTYVSQMHARLADRDGSWYVEDLGSTNGTYLNRRRVAGPMVIKRRDKLQIGNTVLELQ